MKDNFFGITRRFSKISVDLGKISEKEINLMKLDFVINEATLNATSPASFFRHLSYEITFQRHGCLSHSQFHGSVILLKEVLSLKFDLLWFPWYTT